MVPHMALVLNPLSEDLKNIKTKETIDPAQWTSIINIFIKSLAFDDMGETLEPVPSSFDQHLFRQVSGKMTSFVGFSVFLQIKFKCAPSIIFQKANLKYRSAYPYFWRMLQTTCWQKIST